MADMALLYSAVIRQLEIGQAPRVIWSLPWIALGIKRSSRMLREKQALLLDMNHTFMFGEDRFGESEDFSQAYVQLGGTRSRQAINDLIRAVYAYLEIRYPDEHYRHCFPSVENAIQAVTETALDKAEIEKVIHTFALHELGYIPQEYAAALHKLRQYFILAAVIDIWSPKTAWLQAFEQAGILELFSALSFSSDHGMVKPSPKPFERVLRQLGLPPSATMMVGDSPRRDLGGAKNAGIDCILVGGASHPDAVMTFENVLALSEAMPPNLQIL